MQENSTKYIRSSFVEFVGNPLVEALPLFPEPSEIPQKLLVQPKYMPEDRLKSMSKRLFALQRISALHIPTPADTDIALNLSRCLIWGYFGRNPVRREVTKKVLGEAGYTLTESEKRYIFESFTAPVYGFPVIGLSGVGKSTSVVNALKLYPQVIRHTFYEGEPFIATQVVWLKVDTPCDGSPKGLCAAIIRELDAVAGTQYSAEFVSTRISKDALLMNVSQLAASFHLGVMVLDEVQNLCSAKKEISRELLNFLISLANTIRVPIVMIGSPMMSRIFQSSFQQAKRVTGQGEVRMDLMKKEDRIWNIYFRSMWNYQYTMQNVEMTPAMVDVFFTESVGNPFICSILYKLVQDDAIISRRETFNVEDVRRIASKKLGLTAQMRKDMLEGKDVDLSRFEPLWNAPVPKEEESAEMVGGIPDPIQTMQQKIAAFLISLFGADTEVAMHHAKQAIEQNPATTSENVLFRFATQSFLEENRKQNPTKE